MVDPGDAHRRDPSWILGEALRLADTIWENEDRNVERRPGYDVEVTVNAAVELAGAVKALDGLLETGYPLPHSWRKYQSAAVDGEVHEFRLEGWRRLAWPVVRVPPVTNAIGFLDSRVPLIRGRLRKVSQPWKWKQS